MNTSTIEPTAAAQHRSRPRPAVAAAVGFAGLAGFELALALGAPLGRAAMGGTHTYLPPGLQLASGALTVFWALAALLILRRAGTGCRCSQPGWPAPEPGRLPGCWPSAC